MIPATRAFHQTARSGAHGSGLTAFAHDSCGASIVGLGLTGKGKRRAGVALRWLGLLMHDYLVVDSVVALENRIKPRQNRNQLEQGVCLGVRS